MRPIPALRPVLDLLLPPACLGCGRRLVASGPREVICPRCQVRLVPPPPPRCSRCDIPLGTGRPAGLPCGECAAWPGALAGARTGVLLVSPADRLVYALKYEGWRWAAGPMVDSMAGRLAQDDHNAVLVPVPTTPERQRRRGYNQAALLADGLSRRTGLPVVDALLRRSGGKSQVSLHPSQRRTNVRGAFAGETAPGQGIAGRRVLLVDDVLTTGATACEAARVLDEGGAGEVLLLAFARALPGTEQNS